MSWSSQLDQIHPGGMVMVLMDHYEKQGGLLYPLVMTNSLLLKMTIEIVDFPSYNMVNLSIVMLVYQRVHQNHRFQYLNDV